MASERRKEALKQLRDLRNTYLDLEAKEEKLKSRYDVLESESLAASEKLDMLQARLAVATADLKSVEDSISDTKAGKVAKGKLKGLPNPQAQMGQGSSAVSLMKKMMGNNDTRSRVDDGKTDEIVEIHHKAQKCTFNVDASYKFRDLIRDATRYWDLPEEQCVVVSKNMELMDSETQVWPNEALVKYELDRMTTANATRPRFMLEIKPQNDEESSDSDSDASAQGEHETESQKRRRLLRKRIESPTKRQTIIELCIYVTFVAFWLRLLLIRRSVSNANLMTSAVQSTFVEERFGDDLDMTYVDITETDQLFQWLSGPVKDGLFVTTDYNGNDLPTAQQNRVKYFGMPIGSMELKQYRVTNSSCDLTSRQLNSKVNMTDMYYIPACYGFYKKSNRDSSNFGPQELNTTAIDDGSGFTYHPKKAGEFSVYISGNFGKYPSTEAFIREIAFGDITAYEDALTYLQENDWIDRGTRAVIISLLLYEPNFDSYVASQFMIEQVGSGLMYPQSKFRVIKMEIFTNWFTDILFMVTELVVYTFVLYYFLSEFLEIRLYWEAYRSLKPYIQNIFNLTDWTIIMLQSTTVIIRVIFFYNKTRKTFSPFDDLADVDPNLQSQQATKLQTLAFGYDLAFQIDSLLICIMFFKFFKFFNLSPSLMMLWYTLVRAMKDISILMFMAALLFLGFSTMANNLFGADMASFSTIVTSFSTLLQVLIGVFDYAEMVLVDRVWCRLFFTIYVVFMFFIMLNVFLAILNDSYLAERKIFMAKYGDISGLMANTRNISDMSRFLVLYAQDKNRQRKVKKADKRRERIRAQQRKIELERKRKKFIEDKKRKREAREAAKEQAKMDEENRKRRQDEGDAPQ